MSSHGTGAVLRYDGRLGTFIDAFVPAGSGGLSDTEMLAFGPDGHLYVASGDGNRVLRYDGTSGAPMGVFAAAGNGLSNPHGMAFGPDGDLYVASFGTAKVLRYDGTSGAYRGDFVSSGAGGLVSPHDVQFGPDGHLYVSSFGANRVFKYSGVDGSPLGDAVPPGNNLNAAAYAGFAPELHPHLTNPTPGLTGQTNRFTLSLGTPGDVAVFLVGTQTGVIPFCPAQSVFLADALVFGFQVVVPDGTARLQLNVPAGVSGIPLLLQALELPSCRVTGVNRFTFP